MGCPEHLPRPSGRFARLSTHEARAYHSKPGHGFPAPGSIDKYPTDFFALRYLTIAVVVLRLLLLLLMLVLAAFGSRLLVRLLLFHLLILDLLLFLFLEADLPVHIDALRKV